MAMWSSSMMILVCTVFGALSSLLVSGEPQTRPMKCSLATESSCRSYLYISNANQPQAIHDIAKNFNVDANVDILTPSWRRNSDDYVVAVKCGCDSSTNGFLARARFTPVVGDSNLANISSHYYDDLVYIPDSRPVVIIGKPLGIKLFCGCSVPNWTELLTYTVQPGDSLAAIASMFVSDASAIENLSGIADGNVLEPGQVLFIPINQTLT